MKAHDMPWDVRKMEKIEQASNRIGRIIDSRDREPFTLPPDFDPAMDPAEEARVSVQLEALDLDLRSRGFSVTMHEKTPLKARSLYTRHVALLTEGLRMPERSAMYFDGCGGWCDDCFQKDWCYTDEDIGIDIEFAAKGKIDPFAIG